MCVLVCMGGETLVAGGLLSQCAGVCAYNPFSGSRVHGGSVVEMAV